ncbi:MAG: hypothetical protein IT445_04870 [Phycisphaeraceae bacterium]|nr:hypothetical protein [Phycisphaeraceae bacterium]
MPSIRQKIYNVISKHLCDSEFSRGDVLRIIDQDYPRTNHESILPSDYLCRDSLKKDPSNDDNRGNYQTYPRFLERLGRNRYRFVGWDGKEPDSIDAPVLRNVRVESQRQQTVQPKAQNVAPVVIAPGLSRRTGQSGTAALHATMPMIVTADFPTRQIGKTETNQLWSRIEGCLNAGLTEWRTRIVQLDQVTAIEARERGRVWTDNECFEGLVRSVLSNSTDWAKVEAVLPEMGSLFHGFDLRWYAQVSPSYVGKTVIPWFMAHRAGSLTLDRDLKNLILAAQKLVDYSKKHGSLEKYFTAMFNACKQDAKAVAVLLGSSASRDKLPTLGIPLAAEFLKNIGYDVSKPDRHICRAVGCFGWIRFTKWPDKTGTKAPKVTESELQSVMRIMEVFAKHVCMRTTFVDNAVWLLCAKSGLYMTNDCLAALSI